MRRSEIPRRQDPDVVGFAPEVGPRPEAFEGAAIAEGRFEVPEAHVVASQDRSSRNHRFLRVRALDENVANEGDPYGLCHGGLPASQL